MRLVLIIIKGLSNGISLNFQDVGHGLEKNFRCFNA